MEDREYQRTRKTRDGGPSPADSDADRTSVAEGKSERFAGLPFRTHEAFADHELDHDHIIILWWIVGHITPPMWRYARHIRQLATELRWEEEAGKSLRTLRRKIGDLDAAGWIAVKRPKERSRKPWIFTLGGVALKRQGITGTPLGHVGANEGGRFVPVDTLTGELLGQSPSGLEGGSEEALQDIDSRRRRSIVVNSNTSKGLRGVPR